MITPFWRAEGSEHSSTEYESGEKSQDNVISFVQLSNQVVQDQKKMTPIVQYIKKSNYSYQHLPPTPLNNNE